MRESRSYGSVGERGGNESHYPEKLVFPSIISMINQLKFRTDRPCGATFVELNPYRCMLARALRSGVRNPSTHCYALRFAERVENRKGVIFSLQRLRHKGGN